MSMNGTDQASRCWRRQQAEISNDYAGLPSSVELDAFVASLDALELDGERRLHAMKVYFKYLADNKVTI